jgi:N utilization substance protein B
MSEAPREVRTSGRELALAVLCHLESYAADEHDAAARLLLENPPIGEGEGEDALASLSADPRVRAYAEALVALYRDKAPEIDALVDATSRTWKLARMDRVDRNVVRLATAELIGRPQTPRAAIVSEAVRLAARYGSERSAAFVNGLVEALAQSTRPATPPAGEAAGEDGSVR